MTGTASYTPPGREGVTPAGARLGARLPDGPRSVALVTSARSWRGSGSVFATVGKGLAARGHAVVALVASDTVAAGFRQRGLDCRTIPIAHTRIEGVRALRHAFRELATDVTFVDKPRDIRLAAVASLGSRAAVVYCMSTAHPPRDALTRVAFRRVRLTVFLGHELANRALLEAPFLRHAPYRVIPNGVDCDFFRPDPQAGEEFRRLQGLGSGPVLVGVGALSEEKRWELLLESLAALAPPRPPLVLCGSGPREASLRALAQRLQLEVRLPGTLDRAQLVGAYNAATCVVHPGPEACSLALLEALACGRPVLAVEAGGTGELVGTAGVLAPPEDARAFAARLQQLLGDAPWQDALGTAARQRAVQQFTIDRMVAAYADVVESRV